MNAGKLRFVLIALVLALAIPVPAGVTLYPPAVSRSFRELGAGTTCLAENRPGEARAHFQQALVLWAANFHAQANLAILAFQEQDMEGARAFFVESLRVFDEYRGQVPRWKTAYAIALELQAAEASTDTDAHVTEDAEAAAALEAQREAWLKTAARMRREAARERDMTYPGRYRFEYGKLLYALHEYESARDQYVLAVTASPDLKEAWAELSVCWFLLGNCEEARAAYGRAWELGAAMHPDFVRDLKSRCGE